MAAELLTTVIFCTGLESAESHQQIPHHLAMNTSTSTHTITEQTTLSFIKVLEFSLRLKCYLNG